MSDLNLRVFARVDDPSPEFFEYLSRKEHVESPLECWVDLDTPRDFEWSDEIGSKTVQYGIADDEGEILATFDTLEAAITARGKAKLKFQLILNEDEDPRPKGAPAPAAPLTTEMLTTAK